MDSELFTPNDSILFVGEGNFSFALSFKNRNYDVKHITATCFEKENFSAITLKNIEALKDAGVKVCFGIDATKLCTYPDLVNQKFNCIIFNFPHIGGKMKIDRNRVLLKEFFASCATLISLSTFPQERSRRVLVSLCKGQGGTEADGKYLRTWGDCWQVVEMAAISGLVLTQVKPFNHSLCPGYASIGFRGKEKWFHTDKSLIHTFQPSAPILVLPRDGNTPATATINTPQGKIICDRFYLEYSDFIEVETAHYEPILRENSLEMSLFQSLYSNLINVCKDIQFISPSKVPLVCDSSKSNVPCIIEHNTSFLRGSFFEVINCYVGDLISGSFISHGTVFQSISNNFSVSPCRQQLVINSVKTETFIENIISWISDVLIINPFMPNGSLTTPLIFNFLLKHP